MGLDFTLEGLSDGGWRREAMDQAKAYASAKAAAFTQGVHDNVPHFARSLDDDSTPMIVAPSGEFGISLDYADYVRLLFDERFAVGWQMLGLAVAIVLTRFLLGRFTGVGAPREEHVGDGEEAPHRAFGVDLTSYEKKQLNKAKRELRRLRAERPYAVVRQAVIRSGVELGSERIGDLVKGQVIQALETSELPGGQVRVHPGAGAPSGVSSPG